MSKTAAIVVTYNRKELLLENVSCLLTQTGETPDILIVDNNSTDGTAEALAAYRENEHVYYRNTGKNLGGAGGFSFGVRWAVQKDYDYLWLMDDDCMPQKDALAGLLEADRLQNGNYGFLSSKVLWKDGTLCKTNIQRNPLTRNITDFEGKTIPVTLASFVSLFLKRSVVLEMGLPIREFFVWTDDWEYTRRISRKYPCFVVPGSVVVHKSATNKGIDISSDTKDRVERYWYLYRNDVYLYRREGIRGFLYEMVRLTGHCLRVLLHAEDSRGKRLRIIFAGTMAGLSFHPEIEYIENEKCEECS